MTILDTTYQDTFNFVYLDNVTLSVTFNFNLFPTAGSRVAGHFGVFVNKMLEFLAEI